MYLSSLFVLTHEKTLNINLVIAWPVDNIDHGEFYIYFFESVSPDIYLIKKTENNPD